MHIKHRSKWYYGSIAESIGDMVLENDTWRIRIRKTPKHKRRKVIREYIDAVCAAYTVPPSEDDKKWAAWYLYDCYFNHKTWN